MSITGTPEILLEYADLQKYMKMYDNIVIDERGIVREWGHKVKSDEPKEKDILNRNLFFTETKKKVYYKSSYLEAQELLLRPPLRKHNKERKLDVVVSDSPERLEFCGGTYQEALEIGNIDFFNEMREKLESQNVQRKIVPQHLLNRKRRRIKSEFDGDYNFDEKWSMYPFSSARRQRLPIPSIRLVADFSIHCAYESKQINAFGAVMWSLCQMLESIGVNVEVVIRAVCKGFHDNADRANTLVSTITVKNSGEYISPIAMTTCFRSVYYRRVIFNADILAADFVDGNVSYGLGSPEKSVSLIDFKDGELILEIDIVDNLECLGKKVEEIFAQKGSA